MAVVYAAHLVAAVFGAAMFSFEVTHMLRFPDWHKRIEADDCVRALVSFGLGYFVYHKWKSGAAKWIWVVGVAWFVQGALHIWLKHSLLGPLGRRDVILWEFRSRTSSIDVEVMKFWSFYTLSLVCTTFYSAGAFCRARFGEPASIVKMLRPRPEDDP